MIGERRKATYRLIGYLMIVAATVLFGFNGTLSRLLFDDGVSLITLVEMRMLIVEWQYYSMKNRTYKMRQRIDFSRLGFCFST